jgi:predicted aspartyl protease
VKRITSFDPAKELIYVAGQVEGPRATAPVRLVIDTAATDTLIAPDIIDLIGYSPRDAERATSVTSAIGKEHGYILRVRTFAALGVAREDVRVHVFDLPDRYGIDGLIGLSFLRALNVELRFGDGEIVIEPIAA